MKHILRIDELVSIEGEAPLEADYQIIWSNGKLVINPDYKKIFTDSDFLFPIAVNVEQKHKLLKMRPMDDWADLKIIKKIQQMLNDMKKSKLITDDWTCQISNDKETKRTLGSNKVGAILKYDANLTDIIPFAFHGTTSNHLEDIKRFGLTSTKRTDAKKNWKKGYTHQSDDMVYMTMDYDRALYYARNACEENGGTPIIVEVKNLPVSMITLDDDFLTMGSLRLMMLLKTGKSIDSNTTNYVQGIRMSGQFAVTQRIPPTMITKIYTDK